MKIIITVLLSLFSVLASAGESTVFTEKGYLTFTVDDHWPAVVMKTKPPIAIMAYQLLNKADEGTPDSTNISINLFTKGSQKAKEALESISKPISVPKYKTHKDWKVTYQEGLQGNTLYTIIDAQKEIADVIVVVRVGWPHLSGNEASYGKIVENQYYHVVESIYGDLGKPVLKEGEKIWRPN